MIQTQFFGEMIRVLVRKSELQCKSQRPESRRYNRRPKQMSESVLGSSAKNGLKAFMNPNNPYLLYVRDGGSPHYRQLCGLSKTTCFSGKYPSRDVIFPAQNRLNNANNLRLRNPRFRNRKPQVFISRHPTSRPPKTPFKTPTNPPLLVQECIGVHSTMERSAGANFGGRDGGFWGGSGWRFMKTRGFLTRGFRNL